MSHNNNPYSDNDYNLFPRHNALSAILLGVETFVGQTFASLDNCKQELKQIGLTNQTPFTTGRQNDIERNAIQDERNKFVKFIDSDDAREEYWTDIRNLPGKKHLTRIN